MPQLSSGLAETNLTLFCVAKSCSVSPACLADLTAGHSFLRLLCPGSRLSSRTSCPFHLRRVKFSSLAYHAVCRRVCMYIVNSFAFCCRLSSFLCEMVTDHLCTSLPPSELFAHSLGCNFLSHGAAISVSALQGVPNGMPCERLWSDRKDDL